MTPTTSRSSGPSPGYVGHDQPELVAARPDRQAGDRQSRAVCAQDLIDDPSSRAPEFSRLRPSAVMLRPGRKATRTFPMAVEIDGAPTGYQLGTGVRIITGAGGRDVSSTACTSVRRCHVSCDGAGEASNLRFTGVLPGDEVHVDNRAFLAYCYYSRHHVNDRRVASSSRVDGVPIYPQHQLPTMSPFMGVRSLRRSTRASCMWVHHTHDASLWPSQGIGMTAARRAMRRGPRRRERVPAPLDRERRARPAGVRASPAASGQQHLAYRLPAHHRAVARRSGRLGGARLSSPGTDFNYADGHVTLPANGGRARRHPARRVGHRQRRQPGRGQSGRAGHACRSTPRSRRAPARSSPPNGTSMARAPIRSSTPKSTAPPRGSGWRSRTPGTGPVPISPPHWSIRTAKETSPLLAGVCPTWPPPASWSHNQPASRRRRQRPHRRSRRSRRSRPRGRLGAGHRTWRRRSLCAYRCSLEVGLNTAIGPRPMRPLHVSVDTHGALGGRTDDRRTGAPLHVLRLRPAIELRRVPRCGIFIYFNVLRSWVSAGFRSLGGEIRPRRHELTPRRENDTETRK